MGILLLLLFVAICFVLIVAYAQRSVPLPVGAGAPSFSLADQAGRVFELSGKQPVILAFFPRDNTSRCIGQMREFASHKAAFEQMGFNVYFIAVADVESNRKFADACATQFPILADVSGEVSRAYGSIINFGVFKFAKRSTFVIDGHGRISGCFIVSEPAGHAKELLDSL